MPPFIGEIRMFAGNFEPAGWAICDGRPIPISENDALFTLIGTTYGGDGQNTFNLPDLRSRIPIHTGNGVNLAETGGSESVTLTTQQIPGHTHAVIGSQNFADKTSPQGNLPAKASVVNVSAYGSDQPLTTISPASVTPAGGSQPHDNMMPYLCINYIISLFGEFPHQ
jgi:microcystin-dependent protein